MNVFGWLTKWFKKPRQTESSLVPYFDAESQQIVKIPPAELGSGVVEVDLKGYGVVWVNASELQAGPVVHSPFDENVRDVIRGIQYAFEEHRPLTFEQWEDGFQRDRNAMKEIAIWSRAAQVYKEFAEDRTESQRREVYRCIVACMTTSQNNVWHVLSLGELGKAEMQRIIDRYFDFGELSA